MRPSRPAIGHRPSVDPVVHRRRIDPVLTDLGVDEHHRDGRVPLRRVGDGAAVVTRKMGLDPFAQRVVVGDRHCTTICGSVKPPASA